ncbi:DMT family transporter [Streptomyces yaizuensis]|uniref:DMT family transporter n=1 Tax=Streptomyces yaizuensis TaxID=2989713 RepID=A0ABQ5NZ89_9ACTN|nr:DMT family transporter [Streptomyces sp. YSPA8]GLF95682.1 DMT family transporter [Streptomyces sp. YSPA8]
MNHPPQTRSTARTTLQGVLLVSFAYCLVGASFTANSVLGDYPYAGGQAVRYALAFLLLLPLLGGRAALGPVRALTPRQWGRIALLAAVGMVGFNLAVLAAERTSEPAVPGVFVGCAPVIVAVLVPLMEGRRPTRPVLYGALLVAAGAFTVQGWGRTDTLGVVWSVAALLGEVGFAVLAAPVLRPLGPRLLTAVVCAVAAVESAVIGVAVDGDAWVRMPDQGEALALLWQAAVVTVIGFVAWYMGIQRIGAERATLFTGLIPVAAALTAPVVGTGTFGAAQAAGGVLVGAGAVLGSGMLRPGRRRPAETGSRPAGPGRRDPGRGPRRPAVSAPAAVQQPPGDESGVVAHRDGPAPGQPHRPRTGDGPPGP